MQCTRSNASPHADIRLLRLLPPRHGAAPVNHSITHFNHVILPSSALLGHLDKSETPHEDFLTSIWRVSVGTLSLSACAIPLLQIATRIVFKYSARRMIGGFDGVPSPILTFRTQQLPIYYATAQAYVLQSLHKRMTRSFTDGGVDARVRHAFATVFKAAAMRPCQNLHMALSERCGAQGLFAHNQIVAQLVRSDQASDADHSRACSHMYRQSDFRGVVIAEGDILVLSIRGLPKWVPASTTRLT